MNKKTAIIIIIITILVLAGGFLWFYFSKLAPQDEDVDIGTPTDPIFPSSGGSSNGGGTNTGGSSGGTSGGTNSKLRQISATPVAGAVIFEEEPEEEDEEGDIVIRYVDRGLGHIFETNTEDFSQQRISGRTLPKIYEALWQGSGKGVIMRYIDENEDIATFQGFVDETAENEEQALVGGFLQSDIPFITVSPNGNSIFYLSETSTGVSGIRASFSGGSRAEIFNSPLRSWIIDWPTDGTVSVSSAPGNNVPGSMFLVNSSNGNITPVLSSISGLTGNVSPDGNYVLYTESSNLTLQTFLYDISSGTTQTMPFATLPEKCTWYEGDSLSLYCAVPIPPPRADYPDAWYQGRVSFDDDLWRYEIESELFEFVLNTKQESGEDMDITDIQIDGRESYLIFTNKKDLSLWSLEIN
ncbi:MAG: hypothetical protein COV70_04235 [Parcubacteria group bacterium CG11_big_fil_rev_8_21_14_0_20_39_22]|nr:MAG: hypothetical protein COV70_04235 [Parcubacteria group bacterium CG11_big_fil_rev_8_21_14_0_20_39_22]